MTIEEIDSLSPTLDASQVAKVWGCSSWSVYQMAKAGTCPVAPLHLGRVLRWPTAPVLRSVGLDPTPEREEGGPKAADPITHTNPLCGEVSRAGTG